MAWTAFSSPFFVEISAQMEIKKTIAIDPNDSIFLGKVDKRLKVEKFKLNIKCHLFYVI